MKFAKLVYLVAGTYGLLILLPQYFLESRNGLEYPPPINHPEFYYGFIGVAVAWQVAFLIISSDPHRFRLLMIASVMEKYSHAIAVAVLFIQSRIATAVFAFGMIDLLLGTLFVVAYRKLATKPDTVRRVVWTTNL